MRNKLPKPEIGEKFNRLAVISLETRKNGPRIMWNCKCSCGKEGWYWAHNLINGNTNSCGCYMKDRIIQTSTTHGMSHKRPWNIYQDMLRRCNDKTRKCYPRYGGRGIKVCERWNTFENFWEDMAQSYKENLSLERIDNSAGYSKENCKWATNLEQCNNKRTNRMVTYNGRTQSLIMWCRERKLNYQRTLARLRSGQKVENAFDPSKQKTGSKGLLI